MKELSLNILDIVQNSIRAKASMISISVEESVIGNTLSIGIKDNGEGMPAKMLETVTDPYTTSRTKRKVGLGLPFLRQHAEMAGGNLNIISVPGEGTSVEANFILNHFDRQPLGDISGVLKIMIIANPGIEFAYRHKTDMGKFEIDTKEIKEVLETEDLTDNGLMNDIRDMIRDNLESIGIKA